jgi:CheY-like chemotaxis protein
MKKVLVVDDDIVMYRLFQIQVKRAGCEGFFFRDGKSALDQIESIQPDLVVLDYHLPDIEGDELYTQIRQKKGCEDIPVVFVTGTVHEQYLTKIKALGADAVLSKPLSPRKLQILIKELIEIE